MVGLCIDGHICAVNCYHVCVGIILIQGGLTLVGVAHAPMTTMQGRKSWRREGARWGSIHSNSPPFLYALMVMSASEALYIHVYEVHI